MTAGPASARLSPTPAASEHSHMPSPVTHPIADSPARSRAITWLVACIAILLVIFALRLGRGWFVPMAIAWLAALVMIAIFDRISRVTLFGRPLPGWSVHLVGLFGISVLAFALAQVVLSQAEAFAQAIPAYASRIADLQRRLEEVIGPESTERIWDIVASLHPTAVLSAALNGVGAAAGTLVLILLYVAFMLVDGGSFARKIAALGRTPAQRLQITTALSAIRGGVQQYMLVKTLISGGTAIVIYGILRVIGVDFALTWAALSFLLNFIPNIGSIVATALPVVWAAIQFPSFGPPILTLATVGSVQFAFGNILDPMLSGRHLNLGPLVIILSLSFWSMLWGISGAFLAVPITVVLAIVSLHVPPLRPLAVLLSRDEPAPLPPDLTDPTDEGPLPAGAARAHPAASGSPGGDDFAADIAAIHRDQALDAAIARERAMAGAGAGAAAGGAGVSGVLIAGLAEWLGDEVAARTGLDAKAIEQEVQAFLGQVAEDPEAYRTMLAGAGAEALGLVRRHPAAAALVAAAVGFVLSRMRR